MTDKKKVYKFKLLFILIKCYIFLQLDLFKMIQPNIDSIIYTRHRWCVYKITL